MPSSPRRDPNRKPEESRGHLSVGYIIGSLLAVALVQLLVSQLEPNIPYSQFMSLVAQGKVETVTIG